jgi:hypothetical protein
MPCSFALLPRPRSTACAQHHGPLEATVTVRQIPLVTALYGTCGTAGEHDNARSWRRRLPAGLGCCALWSSAAGILISWQSTATPMPGRENDPAELIELRRLLALLLVYG